MEEWDEDVTIDDHIEGYIVQLYKVGKLSNSKLLCCDIKIPSNVSSVTRGWDFKDKVTLNCIIYNLVSCMNKGSKLIYSRRKDSFNGGKKSITVYKVKKCVDWLEKEGYIINSIGIGSDKVENRVPSYMEPTDKLKAIWAEKERLKAEIRYIEEKEGIELRDKNKDLVDFRGSKAISHMNSVVKRLNALNESSVIVDGNGDRMTNIYCRIFNETFDQGGRFYRADVLAIRNKGTDARLDIKIDGEEVVEVDYSNLHFRIACAVEEMCVDCLPLDVYSGMIPDESNLVDRRIVKLAVNIMFNCMDKETAQSTIQLEINKLSREDKEQYSLGHAKSVMALIMCAYPDFADILCNSPSFGRTLQNHDSNLASDILEVFMEKGIPCLPVHDSFICQKQYMDMLCDVMGDKFRKRFNVDWDVPIGVKYRENGETVELKISV